MFEGEVMKTRLESAIKFAMHVHEGHLDKGGHLDILHAFRVMLKVVDNLKIPAVLHDVIEDGAGIVEGVTLPSRVSCILLCHGDTQGFWLTDEEHSILNALTKSVDEPYENYIQRILPVTPANMIKIADLEDHLHSDRVANISAGLIQRYTKALKVLTE